LSTSAAPSHQLALPQRVQLPPLLVSTVGLRVVLLLEHLTLPLQVKQIGPLGAHAVVFTVDRRSVI